MNTQGQPTEPLHNSAPGGGSLAQGGFSRRKLFLGVGAGVGAAALVGAAAVEGLHYVDASTGSSAAQAGSTQFGHLMRRVGFGINPAEKSPYVSLSLSDAVDRLLNYQQVVDTAVEQRLAALNLDLSKIADQQRWWLLRMAWSQRPLLEKMTLFWHGHFTSSYTKVGGKQGYARMMVQNQFFRAHAFDTFDNLLLGVTSDPAMLKYLDLTTSTRKAPNENYARESMELFTLGLGNYTQQDVHNAALALTGWHVVGDSTQSRYLPQQHTTETITLLGHSGNLDYKDVVTILANHPATPWFISNKLFTFFAYENPSKEDLQPLVDAYTSSKHNMGAVMKALLLSPQFSSEKAYRSRVKSPTEFTVGVYRGLNINDEGQYLPLQTALMGQTLLNPPNVAGWPGDKASALWVNSGTWIARLNYVDRLLLSRTGVAGAKTPLVNLQQVVTANHIDSVQKFVDYFASFLLDGNLSEQRKQQLVDYFNTKDQSRAGRVTLSNGQSYPLNRARGTLYLMMSLPEYQLN